MKFIHIAIKDLKIRLKDRNTLVMMLLLPVALTAVIGFAFGGDSGISAVQFSLVAPPDDDFLTPALAGFLSQHELFEVDVASEEEARRAVAAGERSAAVIVPDGLLNSIFEGTTAEIRVLTDPASRIKAGIVRSMIQEFATYANAGGTAGRAIFDAIDREHALSDADRWLLAGWMFQWMYDAWSEAPVSIEAADVETKDIDVRAYFAPGFAVLFLLFTMLGSAKTIHEERESGTYDRLLTAPVSRTTFIAGKLTGCYLLASVQILLLVGLASLLFGVNWGSHPGAVVIMALVTAAGASSLAVLIAAVARTGRQTDNVGTAFVLVMSLLGGSMWPIEQAPESFRRIARFTFNYWAHGGFKKLVFYDVGLTGIRQEILVIAVMSAVFFLLATRLLARR